MKQNLNPEPSGSAKSRHLPYLGALCSILLALLFSSCDDFNSTPGASDFSFSKAGDSETVIGMREFLLTVNYPKDAELSFVVTDSSSAPAWSDVASTTSKQVRKFNSSDKQKRELYFSLTTQYSSTFTSSQRGVANGVQTGASGNPILNPVTGLPEVQWDPPSNRYTPTAGDKYNTPPGFMTPKQTYYAYAYQNGKLLGKSEPITLSDYPATLATQMSESGDIWAADPPYAPAGTAASAGKRPFASMGAYLWGMSAWRTADGSLRDMEVRIGEVSVFPIRLIRPIKSAGYSTGKAYGPCGVGKTSGKPVLLAAREGESGQAFVTMPSDTNRAPWGRGNGVPWPVYMTDTGFGAVARADFFDFAVYLGYTSAAIAPGSEQPGGDLGVLGAVFGSSDQATVMEIETPCLDANFDSTVTNVKWKLRYVTE